MKKTLFSSLLVVLTLASPALAENFNLTSYYPAPSGNYNSIRLIPQAALSANNCARGTLYVNSSDNNLPYFCGTSSLGVDKFEAATGPWTLNGNDLFLTDTTTPLNKKIGIGTSAPTFKLTIANDGGILADGLASTSSALPVSGAGTRLMWYPLKGAFRAGTIDNTQWDDANIGSSSVAMGYNNTAANLGATIWGGQNNSTSGGVSPWAPVITGGKSNTTTSELAQILGGESNFAAMSARISGKSNSAAGNYSVIGGGESNTANGDYNTISGGSFNTSDSSLTTTISGGKSNQSSGDYSTISGGDGNSTDVGSYYSTIAGGKGNYIDADYAVVSGGNLNSASGSYSTISGGSDNIASGVSSTITGGSNNICSAVNCVVAGGTSNTSSSKNSTVLGGSTNTASGQNAIVPGGANNTAAASYSLAAGRYMALSNAASNTFLWGYSASAITPVATPNAFIIYSGRMGIRDITPAALLEVNGNSSADDYLNLTSTSVATTGNILTIKNNGFVGVNQSAPIHPLQFGNGAYVDAAGNFMPACSREYKENISDLSIDDAMKTFIKLEPVQYHYKNEPQHEYLGFIAEDVPDLVASQDRKGLSSMDIAAVLTKVVAHQQEILSEQKNKTNDLLKEVAQLKNKIRTRKTTY